MLQVIILLSIIVLSDQNYDKPEGSVCEWQDAIGTCVNIRRCPSSGFMSRYKTIPAPICSFNGTIPIICCTDCDILPENDTIKDELDKDIYKSDFRSEAYCKAYQYLLPYECKTQVSWSYSMFYTREKCIKYLLQALAPTGGEDAKRGDFPHMALLGYGEDLQSAQWLCGGSLISERHILTAAHCTAHSKLGPVRFVSLGMLKRSDVPSYWRQYGVKKIILHPEYRPPSQYHDIAIIETDTVVNWTDGVRPACLSHKTEIRRDEIAYATGWGALGPRKPHADVMQKVELKKLTTEQCKKLYPPHRLMSTGFNSTTQMCYGDFEQPRDTCNGDSGGPLQLRDPDSNTCVYVIIGVTSNGRACSNTSIAGVYTRVSYYLTWIEDIVWPVSKTTIRDAE